MRNDVVGVVVTFHPDLEVRSNIASILEQVDCLFIVDNAASNTSAEVLNVYENDSRVWIIRNQNNEGIAKALNQGITGGLQVGAKFFVLFDQDSCPQENMTWYLRQAVEAKSCLSMAGPVLVDRLSRNPDVIPKSDVFPVEMLITSGSFFSRRVVERIGLMDEGFFIDYVDHDYCLRLMENGGMLFRVAEARLTHTFGDAQRKRFLGKDFFVHSYSPTRRFYMARNRIILYSRYPDFTKRWFFQDIKFWLKDYIKLVLFETDKWSKIKAIFKGTWAALKSF